MLINTNCIHLVVEPSKVATSSFGNFGPSYILGMAHNEASKTKCQAYTIH